MPPHIGPRRALLSRAPTVGGGAVSPSSVLWSTATKHADITLSGTDNLVATLGGAGGAYRTTRATAPVLDGEKKFWEITVAVKGSASAWVVGACLAGQLNTAYVGNAANTGLSWSGGGNITRNGTLVGSDGSFAQGVTILNVLDRSATDQAWWYTPAAGWRGLPGGSDDPTTDTGGLDISAFAGLDLFPAVSLFTTGDQAIANFGHSPFVNTTQVAALLAAGFTPLGS